MTWVEFREHMAEDPIGLLPFGSQEEQGPVAPMGDYMLTKILADRIFEAADVTDCCDNGIAGGESAASSAEAGARISKHIIDFNVEFLEHFRTVDPRVDRGTESPG